MATSEEFLALINDLSNRVKAIVKDGGNWLEIVGKIVHEVVPAVETIAVAWQGSDKKALAQEVVVDLQQKYLNIKWLPDSIERSFVKNVAGVLIDKAVKYFNDKGIFKHSNPV